MKEPKYKSRIAGAIHQAMRGAHKAGVVDKTTMREFDAQCLSIVEESSRVAKSVP